MNEIDKKLKSMLIKQIAISRPLSDKLIKDLANPRYASGKLMKYGDIPLHVLECFPMNPEEFELKMIPPKIKIPGMQNSPTAMWTLRTGTISGSCNLRMILLEQSEIDEFCRKYWYAGGNEKATQVIKRPE
jgi:hypothetical protein